MIEKSLRPDGNSMVMPIRSQMPDPQYMGSMKRTLSKINYLSDEPVLYLTALGGAIPNAVSTAEILKRKCDDVDVNVVYTAIGTYLTRHRTKENPEGCISRIVIGLSKGKMEPQCETLETKNFVGRDPLFESVGTVVEDFDK
ncbi:MAG: ribonuclease P subunit p25 family protein [Candidatus Aenigmatarchaeota archaeon]